VDKIALKVLFFKQEKKKNGTGFFEKADPAAEKAEFFT
jgi:hypothetical protein